MISQVRDTHAHDHIMGKEIDIQHDRYTTDRYTDVQYLFITRAVLARFSGRGNSDYNI